MLRNRTTTLLLPALALIFGASAASAQTLSATPGAWAPTYAKGTGIDSSQAVSVSIASGGPIDYTIGNALPAWLQVSCGGQVVDNMTPDTCTFTVKSSAADHMAAGSYSSNVLLQISGVTDTTFTVSLTITAASSPLTSTPSPVALSYVKNGVANQSSARTTSTMSSNDTAFDTYTVASSYASWLSVSCLSNKAKIGTSDTCTFQVVQTPANALSVGLNSTTVHFQVAGQPDYVLTVNLTVSAAQPLTTTTSALAFNYVKNGSVPSAQNAVITVPSGTLGFTVDPATVPIWLTVSPTSGTASTSGTSVTLTPVSTVIKGLATGNFPANIGFTGTGSASELVIPVTLTVSNTAATVSVKESPATINLIYNPGQAVPAPVVTALSSDEPLSFTASCAVTSTNPVYVNITTSCVLSSGSSPAPSVTGVAYTWGTPLTTTFDSALFGAGTPYGTVITEVVTIVAGTQSPVTETYKYTVQPVDPTFTAIAPTSINQIAVGNSVVVTLTGTNFVGQGNIVAGSSLSPTRVFVAGTDMTSNAVVMSPTLMSVSIPQTSFPAIPSGKTTVALAIGVANQTGSSAPTVAKVSQNLTITTAPVIYGVTSTATYNQPLPGAKPVVAPYELISIFGANFGVTNAVSGTPDAFSKYPATVNISGLGTQASPFVTLGVTFKVGSTSFPAPIIFANASQINAIVPSGLTVNGTASVTVTSGTLASDGLYQVSVVAADPGIFTLSSQGTGQGAILNQDFSVNGAGNGANAGDIISIYMTGLGAPNSTAIDNAANAGGYPAGCVAVTNTAANSPGYLQVVNTTTKTPAYTAPATAWTSIDGAVINQARLAGSSLPPCFTAVPATAVSVTFGTGGSAVVQSGSSNVLYAGLVSGSVTGLYQINVKVPSGLASGAVPVMVTLGTEGHSPAGVVTMTIQ